MQSILLYIGSSIIFLWGVGHLFPTKNIVNGFGELSKDNKNIITMEWIAEGLTLIFLGLLVFLFNITFGATYLGTHLTARICAGMLIVMAILSAFTGARTTVIPMKLCPYIKSTVAIIYVVATVI